MLTTLGEKGHIWKSEWGSRQEGGKKSVQGGNGFAIPFVSTYGVDLRLCRDAVEVKVEGINNSLEYAGNINNNERNHA